MPRQYHPDIDSDIDPELDRLAALADRARTERKDAALERAYEDAQHKPGALVPPGSPGCPTTPGIDIHSRYDVQKTMKAIAPTDPSPTQARTGSCTIQPHELLQLFVVSIRPVLALAAKKGCPIKGLITPELDPRYDYERTNLPDGSIQISWRPAKPARTFRAGDTVHHHPSNEDWILATDEENGRVSPSGWPESRADAADCSLIKPATDELRLATLQEWSATGKGHEREQDHRTRAARRQLAAEPDPLPTP